MPIKEEFISSSSPNIKLYTRTWTPEKNIIATVLFIHGLGEHCARYDEMFTTFAKAGIKTTSFDSRGFGQTCRFNGVPGLSDGVETTMKDIKIVGEKARLENVPHYLFGHSMGGYLALRYASLYPEGIIGVIASAPLVKAGAATAPNIAELVALNLAPSLMPNFIFTGKLEIENLSRDKSEVEKYKKDPLIHGWGSFQLLQDLAINSKDLLSVHAKKFSLPLLISHGSSDRTTCPKASKEFVQLAASKDKTFHEWAGFVHELHFEPAEDRIKVIAHYVEWIKARASFHGMDRVDNGMLSDQYVYYFFCHQVFQ